MRGFKYTKKTPELEFFSCSLSTESFLLFALFPAPNPTTERQNCVGKAAAAQMQILDQTMPGNNLVP